MKKNKLAKNSLAVGLVTLIITAGLSFSANGADEPVSQGAASAVKGTGLFELLDGDACEAVNPGSPTGAGKCGEGLTTPSISAYSQTASANADGTSAANASVAPIDALDLHTTLKLSDVVDGLADIDTGSVLDPVVGGVGGLLKTVIDTLKLAGIDIVGAIDDTLQTVLTGVDDALPIKLRVGAVDASATATPTSAEGTSKVVDGLDLLVDLGGGNVIHVPITAGAGPNANLLISAPQDLVDGIIAGLQKTVLDSLGGSLGALAPVLDQVNTLLLKPLFDALEPSLLTSVADLLKPIVSGTVNKQDPVSPSDGELDVTGLHLVLLGTNTLDLARVHVGPNAGPAADDEDTNADAQADDAQSDDAQSDDAQSDDAQSDDAQSDDSQADTVSDNDSDNDADAAADADADADADVNQTLPDTGAPNLAPLWILGLAFVVFGAGILVNEKRRMMQS